MQINQQYHLAQINVGKILGPIDSPVMSEFVANLDRINALAEDSDGFIWRFKDETNNATNMKFFEDDLMILNMSVWENVDALYQFTYQSMHAEILKRRKEWFERMTDIFMALWYVPAGIIPTPADALERLEHLKKFGNSPYSFSFKKRFTVEEYKNFVLV